MLFPALLFWLASSPVPQNFATQERRVHAIGHQLATANAEMCAAHGKTGWWSGLLAESLAEYPPPARAALAQAGLQARPVIRYIVPGSAAERAGVQSGDVIAAIDGHPFAEHLPKRADYAKRLRLEVELDAPRVTLSIERSGRASQVTLLPDAGCASRLTVRDKAKIGARADGVYLEVNSGAAAFAPSDDELAFVIAHEMAHNVAGHAAWLDAQGRTKSNIRKTEEEADRMALSLMKTAGYDPNAATRFWSRFGQRRLFGFMSDGTHMNDQDRTAFIAREVRALGAQ